MVKKYIDADRLKAEIEKRKHICEGVFERDSDTYYQGKAVAYQETLSLIDSLQQEQPELPKKEIAEYYYHKGVYEGLSQGRADALKILDEFMKRKADPVIVIKQQEQPCDTCTNDKGCVTCKDGELWEGKEQPCEDFEKEWDEFENWMESYITSDYPTYYEPKQIARHFYELGKNSK